MRLKVIGVTDEIYINEVDFSDVKKLKLKNWMNHEVYTEVED